MNEISSIGILPSTFDEFKEYYQMFEGMGLKQVNIKGEIIMAWWEKVLSPDEYPEYYESYNGENA